MSADLERQLARFAEALDRDAPEISFDDIVGRGTVDVDVDLVERPAPGQTSNLNGVSWIDTAPGPDEAGQGDGLIELAPERVVRRPAWRPVALKVAIAVAAAAVLVVSLTAIQRDSGDVGPADGFPRLTTTFVSPRSGLSIDHPDGAAVTPAADGFGADLDGFDVIETGLSAVFRAASTPLDDEGPRVCYENESDPIPCPSLDEQIDQHLANLPGGGCGIPRSQQAEITIDGRPGRVAQCARRIEATVIDGGRGYIFTLSHERDDARAVFDAFVATIVLTPETALDFPRMTTPFVSPTYGFSFDYLDRGGLELATGIWDPVNQPLDAEPWDRFDVFDTGFGAAFAGVSADIPQGVSIDGWVDDHVTPTAADGCGIPRREQQETTIDGQSGKTAECAGRVEATVVAGGRLYLFVMHHNPRTDARAWFDDWIATIDLTPETAEGSR